MTENKTVKKSYKRETAWAMLLVLGYLACAGQVQELEILVVPVFFFATTAFGMQWASTQTNLVGGPLDERKK